MTRTKTIFEQVLTCRDAALLVGLPRTEDQWWKASRFAESFARRYNTPAHYLTAWKLAELSPKLDGLASRTGLTVGWPFVRDHIAQSTRGRRLLLVVSHLPADSISIETGEGFLSADEFWGAFQSDWRGIVYLAGCYSQSFREAYVRRFGVASLPGLNGLNELSADFWLPYYILDYLPQLSNASAPFGLFSIAMNARIADRLSEWADNGRNEPAS